VRGAFKLAWVELKLFLREPMTVVLSLVLPLVTLVILAGVFGNTPDPEAFLGAGPTDYYVPAYLGLVLAAVGVISLPVHLAANRERGVLRRFEASSVSAGVVALSEVTVALLVGTVSGVVLVVAAFAGYDLAPVGSVPLVAAGFALGALMFATLGVMLGALFPTARGAQAAGLLLWFVMLFLSGAGPPPEVLSNWMTQVARVLPLTYLVRLLQDAWLGAGWNWGDAAVVAGITVAATVVAVRFFRWE
jgi:ABC-2 type transport system permease protein